MSRAALNSAANSGLSVGASSLVTDANSALSGGPHLQRSASINAESYNRLPASPMSFSSNNISISGSSVLDGASFVQQSPNQDQNPQQIPQRHQQQGASSASSHMTMPNGQMNSSAMHASAFLIQERNSLSPLQKIPRLDVKQEEIFQQQVMQQLLQRQDSVPLHARQSQLQALYQQKFLQQRQQQQLLQSLPQMQRVQLQQQQQQSQQQLQQQQLRLQLQQAAQPSFATKRPFDSGICARRLMQYLYHQRHRPADNSILYWRKFVAEYFAPRAKKRWCLSLYDNVGHHTLGVFPQAAMDAWHCDICGSKSGRGFETTYDVLPRLSKIKFDSGVIDELLFPGMPQEFRFSNGMMSLEYAKAVQESVYEHIRVVREGQLRIVFTPDLKILSWEFCARRHDELLPRRLVAPQVNQLVQVAQKYQNAVNDSGSTGVSLQELQTNCSMFVTAGRQLAKNLDMQSLNELGFSKRYVRCLQIAEVVNSMKDLIDFSREQNMGPIECLKSYPRHTAATKMQLQTLQEMGGQQQVSSQGLSPDQNNTPNKKMAITPSFSGHNNNNSMGSGNANNMYQTAMSLSKYQNLLRQNSMNSNSSVSQPDGNPFTYPNQSQTSPFQGHIPPPPLQNASGNVLASSNPLQTLAKHDQSSTPANPSSQQDVIQQLLQEMMSNNSGLANPQSLGGQNPSATSVGGVMSGIGATGTFPSRGGANMVGFGNNSPAMLNNQVAPHPSRTNSFKSVSNNSPTVSGNSYGMKQGMPVQNRHLPDIVPDIPREFSDSGIFDDEAFDWKS